MSETCSHMLLRASPCRAVLLYTRCLDHNLVANLLHHSTKPSLGGLRRSVSSMPQDQTDEYNKQWLDTWQQGLQPGQMFDAGRSSPLLSHLLSSGELQAKDKRVIVPGCGRGYDAFVFALSGAAVSVGLDLSPEAIAAAQAEQQAALSGNPSASAAVHLCAGDFFHHSASVDFKGPYDIGYDYTFLCALHPDMRASWAASWSRLLAPGGELVTLIFPVGGVPDSAPHRNPPWPVTPELYKELLMPVGFEPVVLEPVPAHLSHKPRAGREWLGRWRRVEGSSSRADGGNGQQQPQQVSSNL